MTQALDVPSTLVTNRYTLFYPPCLPGKATTQPFVPKKSPGGRGHIRTDYVSIPHAAEWPDVAVAGGFGHRATARPLQ